MASKAYRRDQKIAKDAAYTYANNPFEDGTRLHRICESMRRHKANMDTLEEDLIAVYGPIGTPRKLIQNEPGSFKPAPTRQEEQGGRDG